MEFKEFFIWFFCTVGTILGTLCTYIFYRVLNSVDSLNVKMAVVVERVDNHGERIKNLEGKHE